jgi:hypothetical protein
LKPITAPDAGGTTMAMPMPPGSAALPVILPLVLALTLLGCQDGPGGEARAGGAPGGTPDASLVPLEALEEVLAPAGEGSGESNLFAADDGRVYLSWFEPLDDGRHALRFSSIDPGANPGAPTWSAPRTIVSGDDFFVNWADFPSMFQLREGVLAAHWPRRSGGGTYEYDVEVAWSLDGGDTWGEPVVPHRDGTLSEHGFVALFPWEGAAMGAVWLDGRKYVGWDEEAGAPSGSGPPEHPEMTLRFTTLTPETLGPEVLLDGRVCECCQTSAALTSRGPLVVYRNRTGAEIRDIWTVRHVDGAWTEPAPVHEDGWEIRACPVNGPMVAADGARAAVAWFTAAGDEPRVRLGFSDDAGEAFSAPIRIDDGDPTGRVAVTLLPGGDALVTWIERAGEGAEVRIRRVTPDGRLGPSETVTASAAARAAGFPRMVRSGDRLVFSWTDVAPGEESRVRTAVARVPQEPGR